MKLSLGTRPPAGPASVELDILIRPDGTLLLPICCKCLSAGATPCEDYEAHQEALRLALDLIAEGHAKGPLESEEVP